MWNLTFKYIDSDVIGNEIKISSIEFCIVYVCVSGCAKTRAFARSLARSFVSFYILAGFIDCFKEPINISADFFLTFLEILPTRIDLLICFNIFSQKYKKKNVMFIWIGPLQNHTHSHTNTIQSNELVFLLKTCLIKHQASCHFLLFFLSPQTPRCVSSSLSLSLFWTSVIACARIFLFFVLFAGKDKQPYFSSDTMIWWYRNYKRLINEFKTTINYYAVLDGLWYRSNKN